MTVALAMAIAMVMATVIAIQRETGRRTHLADELLDGLIDVLVGVLEQRHHALGLVGELHGEGPRGWRRRRERRWIVADGLEASRRGVCRPEEEWSRRIQ